MGFVDLLQKRMQASTNQLPSIDDASRRATRYFPRLNILRRRIYFKGYSFSLGALLLLPLVILIVVSTFTLRGHEDDGGGPRLAPGAPPTIRKISEKYDRVFYPGCLEPERENKAPRANAAFVVLARNKELEGVIQSIKSIERHFNRWFNYPYVFLNDGNFNTTFRETVKKYVSSPVEFGKIDASMWGYPDWVDKEVAREGIRKQGDAAIMYGGMESYHHMCRFYSGNFYKHPLLDKYEWYWRLEPEIKYFCDITYDPFIHMAKHNKTYGFTIAVKELRETVPNIFRYASAYKRVNNITSQGLWEMFVEQPEKEEDETNSKDKKKSKSKSNKDNAKDKKKLPQEILESDPEHGLVKEIHPEEMEGENYNMCHFWSNFEIARLDWFRSKEYNDFFEMMDRSGGFWMERWGDAPIHSLAAGALLGVSDIHYFRDFGYRHTTIQHCPANAPSRQLPHLPYLEETTEDPKERKEEDDYWANPDRPRENGVGCRCVCDTDIVDVEGKEGSCLNEWVEVAGGWASP